MESRQVLLAVHVTINQKNSGRSILICEDAVKPENAMESRRISGTARHHFQHPENDARRLLKSLIRGTHNQVKTRMDNGSAIHQRKILMGADQYGYGWFYSK